MTKKTCVFVLFLALLLASCEQKQPEHAFYYWKTRFAISADQKQFLNSLDVTKLYIRLFDVGWDETRQRVFPQGKIRFSSSVPKGMSIVPVVYITNKVFTKTKPDQVKELAGKVYKEVKALCSSNKINYTELQFDCDWTETTRVSYFAFLQAIKDSLKNTDVNLSATIRLHQVKYYKLTGIPPVSRGMLMFYNMGKIDTIQGHNSIYEQADAAKYTQYIHSYPLHMDVVLPAFSWGIQIRKGRVIGLLNNLGLNDFENYPNFKPVAENMYEAGNSFFYRGFYFMKGDKVKVEDVSPALCKQAAGELAEKLKRTPSTVAIYHLDSVILTRYEKSDFQEIFANFR